VLRICGATVPERIGIAFVHIAYYTQFGLRLHFKWADGVHRAGGIRTALRTPSERCKRGDVKGGRWHHTLMVCICRELCAEGRPRCGQDSDESLPLAQQERCEHNSRSAARHGCTAGPTLSLRVLAVVLVPSCVSEFVTPDWLVCIFRCLRGVAETARSGGVARLGGRIAHGNGDARSPHSALRIFGTVIPLYAVTTAAGRLNGPDSPSQDQKMFRDQRRLYHKCTSRSSRQQTVRY